MRRVHVAALLAALAPATAWSWGCDAHRIVALIASDRMSESARAAATALLAASPVTSETRGCRSTVRNPLADVAMWADAIRGDEPDTAPWHYVELARDAGRGDLVEACRRGRCVTSAIARQIDVLRSNAPPEDRARALRFIVHLVADLHQPLHASGNGDRGGNCLPVAWFDDRPHADRRDRWEPNLHSVWDVELVRAVLARAHATPSQYADELRRRFARDLANWQRAPRDLDAWAWETHRAGVDVAYGRLPRSIPHERGSIADCRAHDGVGERMARLDLRLGDAYVDLVRPTVDAQLAKAGARLASILEAAFR